LFYPPSDRRKLVSCQANRVIKSIARTEKIIEASPEKVFEVLADARNYAYWVVGSKEIREVDADWPSVGSRFHHTVGFGPFKVKDHSEVEEVEAPGLLKLKVKARPFGTGRVTMEMIEIAKGRTHVTMTEDAGDALTAILFNPLTHLLVRGRNVESLKRLAELAEDGPADLDRAMNT